MVTDTSTMRVRFAERGGGQSKLAELQERLERMEGDFQCLLKQLRSLTLDYEAGKLFRDESGWLYDVIEPNFYFNNVYHVELLEGGARKRWVDQTARISHSVYLPRQVPYQFSITIHEFMDATYSDALHLRIDGKPVEWSAVEDKVFRATVPPLMQAFKVDFEVYVASETLKPDATVSFSFSRISITRT